MSEIIIADINKFLGGIERCDKILKHYKGTLNEEDTEKCIIKYENQDGKSYFLKLFSQNDSINVERFYNQVEKDWHIPPCLKKGKYGNRFYVIEETIEGKNLKEIINDDDMDVIEIIRTMKKICIQLGNLHDLNPSIIHADLKPENIILSDSDVYLIDFEFVYFVNSEQKIIPRGTKGYIAPEIINGGSLSCATDIYSIGYILNEWKEKSHNLQSLNKKAEAQLRDIITNSTLNVSEQRYNSVKTLIENFTKLEMLLIIDLEIESLVSEKMRLFSEKNAGDEELRDAQNTMNISEEILYLIKNDHHRKIAFTEKGIYALQTKTVKKLLPKLPNIMPQKAQETSPKAKPHFISYDEIICLSPEDETYCNLIINGSSKHRDSKFLYRKFNGQGINLEKLQQIINEIIWSRENLYSSEEQSSFYKSNCELAYAQLNTLTGDDKVTQWDIIIMLGNEANGNCDDILAEIYENI